MFCIPGERLQDIEEIADIGADRKDRDTLFVLQAGKKIRAIDEDGVHSSHIPTSDPPLQGKLTPHHCLRDSLGSQRLHWLPQDGIERQQHVEAPL